MQHDIDDPPPLEGWSIWWYLNRWAEESMRWMRLAGVL